MGAAQNSYPSVLNYHHALHYTCTSQGQFLLTSTMIEARYQALILVLILHATLQK